MPLNLVSDRSKFGQLVHDWTPCSECDIGCRATKKVFGFGTIPAKYLFVGEAPGVTEDLEGLPFVGKSGVLLRKTMNKAKLRISEIFITNTVACRPCDYDGGPNRKPNKDEIQNCYNRLKETIEIVQPKLIVAVGRVAEKIIYDKFDNYKITTIWHPAYILRNGGESSDKYKVWLEKIKNLRTLTTI